MNLIWQFSGQGTGKIFMFLFYILLPLAIGAEEYGKFAYALAVSSIVVQPVVEMGLDMIIVKWVSRGSSDVVAKAFHIRSTAALFSIIILAAVSMLFSVDRTTIIMLFFYFVTISFQNIVFCYFRGIENMKLEGVINPIQKVSAIALLFLFANFGFKNASLGSLALLCSALMGSFLLLILSKNKMRSLVELKAKPDAPGYGNLAKEGMALGAVVFLWMIYFRIDSVMLGSMRGNIEVGIYNIAYKIMEGFFFIPALFMIVFFPKLVKPDIFRETFTKLIIVLGTIGIIGSLLLYGLSIDIIRIIYGSEFAGSGPVLRTLSLVLLPVYLGHILSQSLVALDMNRVYLFVALSGAILNIALNYLLIPSHGAIGAAWATLATEIMVVFCCGYFVWRKYPGAFKFASISIMPK